MRFAWAFSRKADLATMTHVREMQIILKQQHQHVLPPPECTYIQTHFTSSNKASTILGGCCSFDNTTCKGLITLSEAHNYEQSLK